MSLFSDAMKYAADVADSTFGTTNFTSAYTTVGGFANSLKTSAVGTAIGSYAGARFGANSAAGFTPPTMKTPTSRAVSSSASTFKATKVSPLKGTGMSNPAVQNAWKRSSQNPRIQASLEVVRPTISKRGPNSSLADASIKR